MSGVRLIADIGGTPQLRHVRDTVLPCSRSARSGAAGAGLLTPRARPSQRVAPEASTTIRVGRPRRGLQSVKHSVAHKRRGDGTALSHFDASLAGAREKKRVEIC